MHVIAYFCFNHSKTLIKRLRSSIKFIYRLNLMAELVYLLILTLQHSHAQAGQAATGAEGAWDFEKKKNYKYYIPFSYNPLLFLFLFSFFSYRVPKCFFHVVPPRKIKFLVPRLRSGDKHFKVSLFIFFFFRSTYAGFWISTLMSIYTLDEKLTGLYIDAVHTNTHKDDTVMWDLSRGGDRETEVAGSHLEVE